MEFAIDGNYIELYKLLKASDINEHIQSGADAKKLIEAGIVLRNGEIETRKSAKILVGETITLEDVNLLVTSK